MKVIRSIRRYAESARIEADIISKINEADPTASSHNVQMLDWFEHDRHVCLVFEQLGRSLYSFMKANDYRPYPTACIADFASQLVGAVNFLHKHMALIHTDLKPENILLEHSGYTIDEVSGARVPIDTRIKLIDFGGATFEAEDEMKSSIVNTRQYRAPEVILRLGWSFPSDCWSLGCILAELYVVTIDACVWAAVGESARALSFSLLINPSSFSLSLSPSHSPLSMTRTVLFLQIHRQSPLRNPRLNGAHRADGKDRESSNAALHGAPRSSALLLRSRRKHTLARARSLHVESRVCWSDAASRRDRPRGGCKLRIAVQRASRAESTRAPHDNGGADASFRSARSSVREREARLVH